MVNKSYNPQEQIARALCLIAALYYKSIWKDVSGNDKVEEITESYYKFIKEGTFL